MVYSTKLGDKICEATATSSIGLRHICKQLHVPYSTVTSWIYKKEHELRRKYAQAKLMQLNHLAEEILEIADDSTNDFMTVVKNGKSCQVQNRETISRSRLRIQARMNLISKLAPILREQQAGKYADEPEVITVRRMRYPNETPEEYLASQNKLDQDYEDSITGARKELKAKKSAPKKKAAGANVEKTRSSSPKTAAKPAPEEPFTIPRKSVHKYYDQRTGAEIPPERIPGHQKAR